MAAAWGLTGKGIGDPGKPVGVLWRGVWGLYLEEGRNQWELLFRR